MKQKFRIRTKVEPMPGTNGTRFWVSTQYCENGLIIVDSNDGEGYTEQEALALATHGANLVYNN